MTSRIASIVTLATAKRQKIDTGAATGPCCKNRNPRCTPDHDNECIVMRSPVLLYLLMGGMPAAACCGFHRFVVGLQILALRWR